jgi:hypothetical protein
MTMAGPGRWSLKCQSILPPPGQRGGVNYWLPTVHGRHHGDRDFLSELPEFKEIIEGLLIYISDSDRGGRPGLGPRMRCSGRTSRPASPAGNRPHASRRAGPPEPRPAGSAPTRTRC